MSEYKEIFDDAKLSIELRLVVSSIPTNRKQEAIDVLKSLIDEMSYKRNKIEHEALMHRNFGTNECQCGRTKMVRDYICHTCHANR